jgi:rhodanese-related sulfurtransferase
MPENPSGLTVAQVKDLVGQGHPVVFIDSRNPIAWGSSRIKLPGALRIPVDQVERHLPAIPRDRRLIVYCTCPADASSARVARFLAKQEFTASYLQGGLDAWVRAGEPTEVR